MKTATNLLTLLLGMLGSLAMAQTQDSVRYEKVILSSSVIGLANPPLNHLTVGAEIMHIPYRWSTVHEISVKSWMEDPKGADITKSFGLLNESRYYLGDYHPNVGIYMMMQLMYQRMAFREKRILGYECINGDDCVYYQQLTSDLNTEEYSFLVGPGLVVRFARIVVDCSFSLGAYHLTVNREDINDLEIITDKGFITEDQIGDHLAGSVRFKIGYVLFRTKKKPLPVKE